MSDVTPEKAFIKSVVEGTNKLEKDSIQFKQFIRDVIGSRLPEKYCDKHLVEQLNKATESLQQLKKLVDELLSDTKDANNKVKDEHIVTLREENRRNRPSDADSGCYSVGSRVLFEVHSTDLSGQLEGPGARTSSNMLMTHPTNEIVATGKLETAVDKLTTESSSPQEHDETN